MCVSFCVFIPRKQNTSVKKEKVKIVHTYKLDEIKFSYFVLKVYINSYNFFAFYYENYFKYSINPCYLS